MVIDSFTTILKASDQKVTKKKEEKSCDLSRLRLYCLFL